ncbi:MAG: protocatechuate 3,4-dioxygenase subunit beta [Aquisalimonadaceae bacterium]
MDTPRRRFIARNRQAHPPAYAPIYKTTVARSPRQALVSVPQTASELIGVDFAPLQLGPHDHDLLLNFNHTGLPIGERIIMFGQVRDQFGKPVPGTLVEMWQANAGGRYRHGKDKYMAPLDPNFGGVGRCLSDAQGWYRFRTVKPGPYPWPNDTNSWRPSHIHVSLTGPTISTRLITQMYFEGDPLIPLDAIIGTVPGKDAIESMIGWLDMSRGVPMDCLAYRFDIVLRGELQTYFED